MESIHTITDGEIVGKLYADTDSRCPQTDWDMLGSIVSESKELKNYCHKTIGIEKDYAWKCYLDNPLYYAIPVYLSLSDGRCDASLYITDKANANGCIYVHRSDLSKEYGNNGRAACCKARRVFKGEIDTWLQWANGNVYGYVVEDSQGNNIDSLWGLFGYDYAVSELMAVVQQAATTAFVQDFETVRAIS